MRRIKPLAPASHWRATANSSGRQVYASATARSAPVPAAWLICERAWQGTGAEDADYVPTSAQDASAPRAAPAQVPGRACSIELMRRGG